MGIWMIAVALTAAAVLVPSQAGFVSYGARSAFDAAGPVTTVDWSAFGPAGSIISTPDSRPYGGLTVGVGSSEGELARHDEGTDFTADFVAGDHLLTDAGSQSDSFILRFDAPVKGFGTQIESDALSGAWTGSIDLYDTADTLIDTIVIGGTRDAAQDGSAPFFGVMSDSANIAYASFWVDNPEIFPGRSGSLAMNTLDVITAAPEPSAFMLLGGGLLLTRRMRRRRQGLE